MESLETSRNSKANIKILTSQIPEIKDEIHKSAVNSYKIYEENFIFSGSYFDVKIYREFTAILRISD